MYRFTVKDNDHKIHSIMVEWQSVLPLLHKAKQLNFIVAYAFKDTRMYILDDSNRIMRI